jgi:hypothetical protein
MVTKFRLEYNYRRLFAGTYSGYEFKELLLRGLASFCGYDCEDFGSATGKLLIDC